MSKKSEDFLKRLQSTFRLEAEERVNIISSGLLDLEKIGDGEEQIRIIELIFREAHSLKGAARSVNMSEVEKICQSLESHFVSLKRKEESLSPELFDQLHQEINSITAQISPVKPVKRQESKPEIIERETAIVPVQTIEAIAVQSQIPIRERTTAQETIRLSTAKLDSLMLQAEEMLFAKLSTMQRVAELQTIKNLFELWNRRLAKTYPEIRVAREMLETDKGVDPIHVAAQMKKLLDFLEWNGTQIRSIDGKLSGMERSAKQDHRSISGMVDSLLQDIKTVLMLPFSSLMELFPKLIRDLSRDQGKTVGLILLGDEVEIDRRILEKLKDPLIHLLRNSIDHGIEKPEARQIKGKPPGATIKILVSQLDGNKVEIIISDDGAGIDTAKVKRAAVDRKFITEHEAEKLNDQEALSLIFQSEVTTSPIITDISGRGLGLAIVRESIEKLGGLVSVNTDLNIGTTFRIVLPLTLATFRGILVKTADQPFVIPMASVERVLRIKREDIKTVENRETILFNSRAVSLVSLGGVLELKEKLSQDRKFITVLILRSAETVIGFSIDEVLDEQEVLVKNLGKPLSRVRNIAGATVLGTGKVVPILNVIDLIRSAIKYASIQSKAISRSGNLQTGKSSILIAEDSITSRTLLKNILESAGYNVKTAVDGLAAFEMLKAYNFDLLVSDVEMPEMSGFELVAKIRSDKRLSGLPVVLVTSLGSTSDRERGIDAGADAYIVKSDFEQSNLLEIIKRLL
jgi:two-component system, chemotaxis family, sensor kinase CheA